MNVAASLLKVQIIMTVFSKLAIAPTVWKNELNVVRSGNMRITEWTKSGNVFFGNRYEAMEFFDLPQNQFRELRKLGAIQKRSLKLNEVDLERIVEKQKAELKKEKRLKRQANREYYLQRALALESEEKYVN